MSLIEDCYLPGNVVNDYRPMHAAKLVPAGSDIGLSIHYTPNGTAVTDHVRIGFTIARANTPAPLCHLQPKREP
jgi:hypothetical protein